MCSCGLAQQRTFIVFQHNREKNYKKKNAEILNVLFLLSLSAYHLETILASVYQAQKGLKIYKRIFSTV